MTKPTTVRLNETDLDLITSATAADGISVGQWIARRAADEALRLHIAQWQRHRTDAADDPGLDRWDAYLTETMTNVLSEDDDHAATSACTCVNASAAGRDRAGSSTAAAKYPYPG